MFGISLGKEKRRERDAPAETRGAPGSRTAAFWGEEESGEAPPAAGEASRIQGSGTIGGPGRGRESYAATSARQGSGTDAGRDSGQRSEADFATTRLAGYDYSDRERREDTAGRLYGKARDARTVKESEWTRLNDYYHALHQVSDEVREAVRDSGIGWDPAVVPDPFIMVESQIDPVVPEPEFRGRDDDQDSAKAKQREYAVRYVCQNNRLEDLNTANERRLKKLGDAFWKVYWDEEMTCGPYAGDIRVRDVPVEALYIDPSAGPDGLQAGQYVDYVYRVHRVRFWQLYREELTKQGLTLDEIVASGYTPRGGLFDMVTPGVEDDEDTVQVLEHWFKHPVDTWISTGGTRESGDGASAVNSERSGEFPQGGGPDETQRSGFVGERRSKGAERSFPPWRETEWSGLCDDEPEDVKSKKGAPGGYWVSAGEIGCTIQAGGHEVKYIPKYWVRTGAQNRLFPFVHYWCIRDENEFYNKSELAPILPLVDAADRELASALLNDAFTANDIILQEENALADGEEFSNVPGAVVKVRPQSIGRVARLGGLQSGRNSLPMLEWVLAQIQRTNRNFETNQGKASTSVKTATELSMLRSDVDSQMEIKKADRNAGFERLYELIDWTALEFFDDGRVIFLGADGPDKGPVAFSYSADDFARETPPVHDNLTGETLQEGYTYWPKVDVTVNAGDGVIRSKAATLQALQNLVGVQVTPDNYKLLSAMLEVLDIPQKQEIIADWEGKYAPRVPPEVTAALEHDPELLGLVSNVVQAQQAARGMRGRGNPSVPAGAAAPDPGGAGGAAPASEERREPYDLPQM